MVSPLEYNELIDPRRSHDKILAPYEIPIHPSVYDSEFAYTPEFMKELRERMPQALRDDIAVIESLVGSQGIKINDDGIIEGEVLEQKFRDIAHEVNPKRKNVSVELCVSSNVGILPWLSRFLEVSTRPNLPAAFSHPMPIDKLKQYMIDSDGEHLRFYTWYGHNIGSAGTLTFHYLRTFAILFNNHGLTKL